MGKKVSLTDKFKFLTAKTIKENPLILEEILGVPVILKEFSGAWESKGIFIKDKEEYIFLTRDYSDPDKNGRGNIILAKNISLDNVILKNKSGYIVKFTYGGSTAIYDEGDLKIELRNGIDVGLMEGFSLYDAALEHCGIPKIRKVNSE